MCKFLLGSPAHLLHSRAHLEKGPQSHQYVHWVVALTGYQPLPNTPMSSCRPIAAQSQSPFEWLSLQLWLWMVPLPADSVPNHPPLCALRPQGWGKVTNGLVVGWQRKPAGHHVAYSILVKQQSGNMVMKGPGFQSS
jgi:hypothetical protein